VREFISFITVLSIARARRAGWALDLRPGG